MFNDTSTNHSIRRNFHDRGIRVTCAARVAVESLGIGLSKIDRVLWLRVS